MLWPASKMTDMVIGLDFHDVVIGIVPAPWTPHPYFGFIFLWLTPAFPKCNVLINGMPAATAGAMGYSAHIPIGIPLPPSALNLAYWRRHLTNIPKVLMLVALTLLANLAIAGIASLFVKPSSASGAFVKDATGVDTSSWGGVWDSIKGSFAAYTKWQTWVKFLLPPLPYPGCQGSAAIGSPNVTVNGGPLAFVAPLMAASCSNLPVVPNAATIGFSNVMVGMSMEALGRAIAVHVAQGAVSAAVNAGVERASKGAGQHQCSG